MTVLYGLLAIGAAACLAAWAWLYFDAPPCCEDDGCDCCADDMANPITQPENWP